MKKSQFLLIKLAEEANEVAQRALKQVQFGATEVQEGQNLTNAERLKREILDLFAITKLLIRDLEIPEMTALEVKQATEQKREKLMKYLNYSALLGQLPEIKL